MKIGFFTDGYLPQLNGVATSVDNSSQALRKRGQEVYVIAAKYPNLKENNKYTIRLNSISLIKEWNLRIATHLPEKALYNISKIDFDVIHGHSGGPVTFLGFEYAKLKKVPYVFTYHTLLNKYTHYFLRGMVIKPKVAEIASKIFCNHCDYIVAPTQGIKKELISYGVTKPIVVIPSGIDVKKFDIKEKGFLRKKLGLRQNQKIVLYVGRFAKEKSIDFLINSFAIVAKKDKNCVFVFVGEGTEKEKKHLKELIKKLKLEKRIYFAGAFSQDDIAKVYNDGYVFVFASDSETQGMVILESIASGLPVVAVSDKALIGVIKSGGNGIITKRDIDDFAKQVIMILGKPGLREKLSENAKETAKKFSVEKNAAELEKLYTSLL